MKTGKASLLNFKDKYALHFVKLTYSEIIKLKECFSSLDKDGSGAIGIEELEDPLIGLGFADNTS